MIEAAGPGVRVYASRRTEWDRCTTDRGMHPTAAAVSSRNAELLGIWEEVEKRVVAHPDQCVHVEDPAQVGASTTNHANATELATVLVERRYPDQFGRLSAIESAEFRQP